MPVLKLQEISIGRDFRRHGNAEKVEVVIEDRGSIGDFSPCTARQHDPVLHPWITRYINLDLQRLSTLSGHIEYLPFFQIGSLAAPERNGLDNLSGFSCVLVRDDSLKHPSFFADGQRLLSRGTSSDGFGLKMKVPSATFPDVPVTGQTIKIFDAMPSLPLTSTAWPTLRSARLPRLMREYSEILVPSFTSKWSPQVHPNNTSQGSLSMKKDSSRETGTLGTQVLCLTVIDSFSILTMVPIAHSLLVV